MLVFFIGFIFGTLGLYVIKKAKKEGSLPKIGIGLALLVYPYFIDSPVVMFLVGCALFGASFLSIG